jgi:ubiquinone/menaquinone biosynthesis C-methylase UbiE
MRSRDGAIRELVMKDYSNPPTQKAYVDMTLRGLWDSERCLFDKYFGEAKDVKLKIIDVGCGCGRVTFQLAGMGHRVTGIDIAPGMIRNARAISKKLKRGNGKTNFIVADALNIPFEKEKFDGATFAFNGWDQIPGAGNRQKALKEVCRVLKPGSFFMFSSGCRGDLTTDFFLSMSYARSFKPEGQGTKSIAMDYGDVFVKKGKIPHIKEGQYIHIPSRRTIVRQVHSAGFEIEFSGWKDEMWPKDARLGFGNCMMFVCRKPK